MLAQALVEGDARSEIARARDGAETRSATLLFVPISHFKLLSGAERRQAGTGYIATGTLIFKENRLAFGASC
ncbi:membrane protein [Altererythrobacter epoxidivorans]|uniref:Membrane protein n=1 Tax=Altererythrobacter epoxidivorans TaxID=361183 RepID=A0A0M4LVG9_9SPHN|nr:membrane protein [Altererythrobacter epoxidivorans]